MWLLQQCRLLATGLAIGVVIGIASAYYEFPNDLSLKSFVYYRNCDAAWGAGVAPILKGQPGYRLGLDRDRDGIACEPYDSN